MAAGTVVSASVLQLQPYTVATVPPAASHEGCLIYVSNGAAGNPTCAFSNGTNWIRLDDASTAIAAS